MAETTQKRWGYIDAFRGWLIFLVLVYHLNSGGGNPLIAIDFCWPFMMPGFFFISGWLSYKYKGTENLKTLTRQIIGKWRCLIVPTFFFALLYSICSGDNSFSLTHPFGGYWFTPELFKIFCIYYLCLWIFRKHPCGLDRALIAVSVIGICASVLRSPILDGSPVGFLAKYITNGRMFSFFTLGYFAQKYRDVTFRILSSETANTIATTGYVISWLLLAHIKIESTVPMAGIAIRWIIAPCTGLFIVWSFFYRHRDFFETKGRISRSCRLIGRRTLDIYMLHYFFLFLPRIGGGPFIRAILFDNDNITLQFAGSAVIALLVIGMCLLGSEIIRNSHWLAYWLLAEPKKNKPSQLHISNQPHPTHDNTE